MKIQKLLSCYWKSKIKALKELFKVQIKSLKELFDVQMAAFKEAVNTARDAMDERLAGMNEFRDTLRDQASKFALDKDLRALKDSFEKSMDELREWIRIELKPLKDQKLLFDDKADRKSVNVALGFAIAGFLFGLIGAIAAIIILLK